MTKRKIILNLAMSIDGYIAREDGTFDWIVGDNDKTLDTKKQFDFEEFLNSIDTIVMGRVAYQHTPEETLKDFNSKNIYVITSKKLKSKYKNIKFINENILDFIKNLQNQKGKDIWLFGGAKLTDEFIKAKIINEYIFGIIPTILGKGKKLFLENNPEIKFHLEEFTSQEGIIILKYRKR